ncbi:MAG TPA: TlpA disulfide reductase family protein [Longimicrobiales bacterium]
MGERMRSRLLTALVLAGIGVVVVLGWLERDRFTPAETGHRAPAYAAPSLAGDTVSLRSLRGRVVLLNVWATWCPPCRWEMPALNHVYRELHDQGLEVVAVSVDAAPGGIEALSAADGSVRKLVDKWGLDFDVLLDPQARVQRLFGVTGLPTTFIIGRDGEIVGKVLGPLPWDAPLHLDRLRQLLEE